MEFKDHGLALRPVRIDDGSILYRWLNDSRVLAFYEGRDRRHDMNMVRERFLSKTSPNPVLGHLVFWQGVPVGYVQTYLVDGDELMLYGYSRFDQVYGMDLFLGEPDRWNQGIGTLLVRAVANRLIQECEAEVIVVDPRVDNLRAVHVYEKCGFKRIRLLRNRELHEGKYHDCWLMQLKPVSKR